MTTSRITLERPQWQIPLLSWRVAALGVLLFLTIMGAAAGVTRLFTGMGATTSLSDSFPWGIWIGFDFAMIAFSGAGFTMAAVVHILHMHRFEAALRPALFAGLFGYVSVLLLLVLDLGRPDRFYHFLLYWNLHSPLFEISWCVLLYSTVLVLEISPEIFERLGWQRLRAWAITILPVVCIIGVTLSTLHQSTLGTLYVNMPHRLHALWYTPYMPALFFVSSVMVGLSVAIMAYRGTACIHRRCENLGIPKGLSIGVVGAAILYAVARFALLTAENKLSLAFDGNPMMLVFWAEIVLAVVIPIALFGWAWVRPQGWIYWVAPALVTLGIGMNRFNATLTAQTPPWVGLYIPHLMEWVSTIGILSGAFLAWLLAVRFLVRPTSLDETETHESA